MSEGSQCWSVDHDWVDAYEGECYVCGTDNVFAYDKIDGNNLCKKHWHECLLDDTDWWGLIRLMREVKDD